MLSDGEEGKEELLEQVYDKELHARFLLFIDATISLADR